MILFFFNRLSNVASHQYDNKYLLLISYHVRIVDYQLETVCYDLSLGEYWLWVLLVDQNPVFFVDLAGYAIHVSEDSD